MSRIAPEGIDEVRDRADLLEVIGSHVRLKQAGREFVGLCPFHDERTPSFSVNPDKGVYLCRGCGASGNVFTFVQQTEGLSFGEAVEHLANRYNITLQRTASDGKKQTRRSRLLDAHAAAVEVYERLLGHGEGQSVRAYCDQRRIGADLRKTYRVGFGGWTPNGLVSSLTRSGFTVEELVEAGLARKDDRAVRDVFWGRLLFPIYDASDRCIGFGGRALPNEVQTRNAPDRPKYLNTSATPLFHKSKVLYGINWARPHAMRTRRLVIVEGYTDVIAMHAAGIHEAVATCGTALTSEHVTEISRRFGDVKVVLCLDGDEAGQSAAAKAGGEISDASLGASTVFLPQVFVALLPGKSDPADVIAAQGPEPLEAAIANAIPIIAFLLDRAVSGHDVEDPLGRSEAVRAAAEVLAGVKDELLRHEYIVWTADRTRSDIRIVADAVKRATKSPGATQAPAPVAAKDPVIRLERAVLAAIAEAPERLDEDDAPSVDDFTHAPFQTIFRLIVTERAGSEVVRLSRIVEELTDGELRRTAADLASVPPADPATAKELFYRLRAASVEREIAAKKRQLKQIDPHTNAGAYDALFEDLLSLERRKRAMTGQK